SLRGMILDLRSNPGGLFSEARRVADLFLEDGTRIVGTTGRSRWENQRFYASGSDQIEGLPMAVIVDRGSASSSEVVAGALQQAGRAILVGDTTYGKGLVQGFIRFPDGDGLKLTISRYYVGDSLYLNQFDSVLNEIGQGLAPDYWFEFSDRNPAFYDLERSLLLFRFAESNKQQILASIDSAHGEPAWLDEFIDYAKEEGFEYRSECSDEIEFLLAFAKASKSSDKFQAHLEKLREKSEALDRSELQRHRDYLSRRLRQLAIQSSYGEYESYRQVLVVEQPVIRHAASLLAERAN
ncbi:MAG: S41 family peptidase, partial [bacterium]|nr:S41 family peptidase [bacterium]